MRLWMLLLISLAALLLAGCQALPAVVDLPSTDMPPVNAEVVEPDLPTPTPFPTRPAYTPGELVDYVAQTGDTLPALAARFNTHVDEILAANPFIPAGATTMPPGMPMQIPIYFAPFWGSPYQILPDGLFVNGPAQAGFDTRSFVAGQPGWLASYRAYAYGGMRSGAEIVDYVALNYSVSPRLLLALLEYQAGALSVPDVSEDLRDYPLGHIDYRYKGLYPQLNWGANQLNNGYYGWRSGLLVSLEHLDGCLERPDPWQNAATVALQNYFIQFMDETQYALAIGPEGLAQVYTDLFGDPWVSDVAHIPGSLEQPAFAFPFRAGPNWAYTGGPHAAWGSGEPMAALDFAPGNIASGCAPTDQWATAVAPGVVARSELGTVVLDLDGDGDERTGWVVFYFHVATQGRAALGTVVQTGDPLGYPSCEGGRATGTHIHIARKYNGEWILADGPLAFNLEGWVAARGDRPYRGTLTRAGVTVIASELANAASQVQAEK